jgi:uncharacterized protein YwgA
MVETPPTRLELMLLLLNARGTSGAENELIRGRTKLQKELFLIQKRLQKGSLSVQYPFKPFKYGPFCVEVYDDVNYLKQQGWLEEAQEGYRPDSGIIAVFKLTERGQSEAKKVAIKPENAELVKLVTAIKQEFNGMPVVDLVRFTHKEYPNYVSGGTSEEQ